MPRKSSNDDKQTARESDPMPAFMRNLLDFAEATIIELPLAAAKRIAGRADDREINEAGWKAYDAVVSVVNDATNRAYSNGLVSRVAAGTMEVAVRVQRLNVALAGAVFANLWPAIGLPTGAEVQAVREELGAIRDEVRAARNRSEARDERADALRELRMIREARERREQAGAARLDIESAMATSGVFQRPMWAGWPHGDNSEGN